MQIKSFWRHAVKLLQATYYERVETFKRIAPDYEHTKSLKNLSFFLVLSVVALFVSFSQFPIGNYVELFTITICITLAITAGVCVLV